MVITWRVGLEKVMLLRNLNEQEARLYCHARSGKGLSRDFCFRVGNREIRRRILSDRRLGELYFTKLKDGHTYAYRQLQGKASTSLVRVNGGGA